ncbi:MAG: hypothetical protein M1812_006140 [Candelaria pacifica]|nr:MAG: hypothetical protein M1812_006140 [Candelaria pacifica]
MLKLEGSTKVVVLLDINSHLSMRQMQLSAPALDTEVPGDLQQHQEKVDSWADDANKAAEETTSSQQPPSYSEIAQRPQPYMPPNLKNQYLHGRFGGSGQDRHIYLTNTERKATLTILTRLHGFETLKVRNSESRKNDILAVHATPDTARNDTPDTARNDTPVTVVNDTPVPTTIATDTVHADGFQQFSDGFETVEYFGRFPGANLFWHRLDSEKVYAECSIAAETVHADGIQQVSDGFETVELGTLVVSLARTHFGTGLIQTKLTRNTMDITRSEDTIHTCYFFSGTASPLAAEKVSMEGNDLPLFFWDGEAAKEDMEHEDKAVKQIVKQSFFCSLRLTSDNVGKSGISTRHKVDTLLFGEWAKVVTDVEKIYQHAILSGAKKAMDLLIKQTGGLDVWRGSSFKQRNGVYKAYFNQDPLFTTLEFYQCIHTAIEFHGIFANRAGDRFNSQKFCHEMFLFICEDVWSLYIQPEHVGSVPGTLVSNFRQNANKPFIMGLNLSSLHSVPISRLGVAHTGMTKKLVPVIHDSSQQRG